MAACGGPARQVGEVGHVSGFAGMVTGDEPRAVMVGRDVLSAGGSAADAAVAMAFTLTATLPSQASLGSGGACLVFDRDKKKIEALDFVAPPPSQLGPDTTRPTALPALPRGLYALHAKYGKLRWEALLGPAEYTARNGAPVSRAFAQQLALVAGPLFEDPEARRIFAKPNGQRLEEGDLLIQPDLGASLTRLRSHGVGELYSGPWSHDVVDAVNAAGGSLTLDDLHNFAPKWSAPLAVPYGNDTAYFPLPPATGGLFEAELWSLLAANGTYAKTPAELRPHLLAETFTQAYGDRRRWMNPEGTASDSSTNLLSKAHLTQVMAGYSPTAHQAGEGDGPSDVVAGTGFAAMEQDGSAVVCNLSLNNTFGVGRVAPGTGIVLAAAPGIKGRGPNNLGPVMGLNTNSNEFRFAAVASGGVSAPTALVQAALLSQFDAKKAGDAVAAPRLHVQNSPDKVFTEATLAGLGELEKRGHAIERTDFAARVNLLQCGSGDPQASRCTYAADPRGSGLAVMIGN